ncbi:aminotransferase class III-fold pyridoxal phosphate-dependent enzyme [Ningiella sp. W23]|uniref:aminotransferase class III-fold pyridoxal phosphate-dependent enzyme n=1 Tax=Ningiella sp. W23 TaxID=3023715 RepID=UPI0037563763
MQTPTEFFKKYENDRFEISLNNQMYSGYDSKVGQQCVLFLHGWPDDCSIWREQYEYFLEHNYRVICIDWIGHGSSAKPIDIKRYSIVNLGLDLIVLFSKLHLKKVHLVAHDYGAVVAWDFVSKHPKLVESYSAVQIGHSAAILRSTSIKGLLNNWFLLFNALPFAVAIYKHKNGRFFNWAMKQHTDKQYVVEKFLSDKNPLYIRIWELANPITWFVRKYLLTRKTSIDKVKVPTCILWGNKDEYSHKSHVYDSLNYIDDHASVQELEGLGHWPMLENPAALNRHLNQWLNTLKPTSPSSPLNSDGLSRKAFLKVMSLSALSLALPVSAEVTKQTGIKESITLPFDSLQDLHKQHLSSTQLSFLDQLGLNIVWGDRKGIKVQDHYSKKWFFDCHRLGTTYNLGHRHPVVLETLLNGLKNLELGNFFLLSEHRAKAAKNLAETTDNKLPGVVFTTTGAEANECAIKTAFGYTNRKKIVCFDGGYHGDTVMTLAAGGDDEKIKRYGLENFNCTRVPFNDVDAAMEAIDKETAALIAEPTVAQLGFPPPKPGYWKAISQHCKDVNALIILDEVQTGGGATGTFWHYQSLGFVPDILVSGKWPSGGYFPNSFALFKRALYDWLAQGTFIPHPTTFGGSELGSLVTNTVTTLLSSKSLLNNVKERSKQFQLALSGHPFHLNINGLCIGIVDTRRSNFESVKRLAEYGVLTVPAIHSKHAVELRPPLIITEAEVVTISERVIAALA